MELRGVQDGGKIIIYKNKEVKGGADIEATTGAENIREFVMIEKKLIDADFFKFLEQQIIEFQHRRIMEKMIAQEQAKIEVESKLDLGSKDASTDKNSGSTSTSKT